MLVYPLSVRAWPGIALTRDGLGALSCRDWRRCRPAKVLLEEAEALLRRMLHFVGEI